MGSRSRKPQCNPYRPSTSASKLSFRDRWGELFVSTADLRQSESVCAVVSDFRPDAVVHLAECPSAPYSMLSANHSRFVQTNNIGSTLNVLYALRDLAPEAHLLKLGTMGEYGAAQLPISEGNIDISYKGKSSSIPFPQRAHSWYHLSKVHDSNNIRFACETWGIRSTDIMQGIVYGISTPLMGADRGFATRVDFDQYFGTIVHRFCAQAVAGIPLTVYGKGSQNKGILSLRDSMQCMSLLLENPPQLGEYRVVNQLSEVVTVLEIANVVVKKAAEMGLKAEINHVDNIRHERDDPHTMTVDSQVLPSLGFRQSSTVENEVPLMIERMMENSGRIEERIAVIQPTYDWKKLRGSIPASPPC